MISIDNIEILFTGKELFSDISFVINPKDRIGLVGKNGVGKSTLLKVIAGKITPDSGSIGLSDGATIGYLPQEIKISSTKNIYEETLSVFEEIKKIEKNIEKINTALAEREDYESDSYMQLIEDLNVMHEKFQMMGGHSMESDVEKILLGLGFSRQDFSRPIQEFSGGWQMRVELAKLLLKKPDVLLLDEPTNHLDIESIIWLEDFFKNYPGALMMVSHDRMFLDNITNRTIEIVFGKIYDYKVPYSKYMVLREERYEQQLATARNQQKFIEDQEKFIERFRSKATKARQVQSKIKQLEKIDRVEVDELDTSAIAFHFPPAPRAGDTVLVAKKLSKNYDEKEVLKNIEYIIPRGEKVAFVGKNGEGKSTMIKMIVGEENYDGELKLGHNVKIGYYAQQQEHTMDEELTVLETIEQIATNEWSNISRIRGLLGAFLFGEQDVDKKVKVLSGGEKSRLALAKLLLNPINLLILDEPTNHLDLAAKEVLKNALKKYDGTLIIVSHDRDFLKGLTTRTFEFSNKSTKEHLGDIDVFLDAHRAASFREFEKDPSPSKRDNNKSDKQKSDNSSYKAKNKEIQQLQKELKNCENAIEKLEAEIAELEAIMQSPDFYKEPAKTQDTFSKHEQLSKDLEKKMSAWEELQQKMDAVAND